MHSSIKTLQGDHKYFQYLIRLVQQQMNAFKSGKSSNYLWLIDGMQLIRQHLNLVHQPVERVFQQKLLSKCTHAHQLLAPLISGGHFIFEDYCNRFIDRLEGALRGRISSRISSVVFGEQAIHALYQQISFEECAVFPYANQLFDLEDWINLEHDIQKCKDQSLIQDALVNDYQHLMQRL